jgi:PAS domain S-box-containing protein
MSSGPLISDIEKDRHKTRDQLLNDLAELRAKFAAKTQGLAGRERVAGMLDGITEPVLVLDDASQVVYANSAAARLFAKDDGAIEGRSLWDLYPKTHDTLFYNAYKKARKDRNACKFRELHRRLGKWFEVCLYPVPGGMTVLFNDITVSRQLEELPRLALTLLHNLKDNVFLMREDGRLFHVNTETQDSLGYSGDELHKMSIFGVVPAACQEEWRDVLARIRQHGSMTFESRLLARDGHEFPVEVYANFIELYGHCYYTVSARDITERKRVEETLEKYRILSENARDIALFIDRDGQILEANRAAVEAYGYTREELLSLTIYDIRVGDPGHHIDEQMDTSFEKGILFEALHRRKDGSAFPVEVSSQGRIIDGRKVLLSIVRDITVRKGIEEALIESEGFNRSVLDALPSSIAVLDETGTIIYVNSGWEKFGVENDICPVGGAGKGINYFEVCRRAYGPNSEESPVALKGMMSVLLGEKDLFEVEYPCDSPDTKRWFQMRVTPFQGRNTHGIVVYHNDITSRKIAEEAVMEAKARAELYVDLMGHDINNMNQVAMGSLEMALMDLEQDGKMDASCKPLLERSMESLTNSSQLIKNVQKLQRASTEGIKLQAVDVADVLKEIIDEQRSTPGKDLTIYYKNEASHCLVKANELLQDVFRNLLTNAIKHARTDRHLTIGVAVKSIVQNGRNFCRVAIEDNGPGVPDEIKDRLFRRFSRGDTKAKGSGLGLYLVKTLVEHYGGNIRIEDRVPGDCTKGARFVVTIPSTE